MNYLFYTEEKKSNIRDQMSDDVERRVSRRSMLKSTLSIDQAATARKERRSEARKKQKLKYQLGAPCFLPCRMQKYFYPLLVEVGVPVCNVNVRYIQEVVRHCQRRFQTLRAKNLRMVGD